MLWRGSLVTCREWWNMAFSLAWQAWFLWLMAATSSSCKLLTRKLYSRAKVCFGGGAHSRDVLTPEAFKRQQGTKHKGRGNPRGRAGCETACRRRWTELCFLHEFQTLFP